MSERLQNKIYNYEVAPPERVWENVNAALDESEMIHEFPSKLYGIEINAPVDAWNKIQASLDKEPQTITKTKKIPVFIRYAAAAAIIAFIAFGSIRLIKSRSENKEVAKEQIKLPGTDLAMPSTTENISTSAIDATITDEKRNDAALEQSKHTLASLNISSKSKIKIASGFYFTHPDSNDDDIYNQPHYAEAIHTGLSQPDLKNNAAGRYITLLTPDGNLIRMSKKLIDLACCVSGEEQDANCKDQLQRWREKIACAPVNVSPGNFMDIFGLVSSLQDNND